MRASALKKKLEDLIEAHGDVEVLVEVKDWVPDLNDYYWATLELEDAQFVSNEFLTEFLVPTGIVITAKGSKE